ncbi:MAG: hypothetical protein MZV65_25745 [Chromatiales bacterium]|nr:hypothetical protein [Chromatiales bacterium]
MEIKSDTGLLNKGHIDANAEYFPEMKKAFRQWLNMLDEHLNCNPEQPCYWYNELTQVSLLASAA